MNALAARARTQLDPLRPYRFLTERERSESGEIVSIATIFLTNRECPWRCLYCDLWKNTLSETVPMGAIPAQIDFALTALGETSCSQIKLYNSGSFFDPQAIPPEDFPAIADCTRRFERVIVECHPALIDESAVRFRNLLVERRSLMTPIATTLEVAMGLEVADDSLLARMNKRMTLAMFRRASEFLVSHEIVVRAFVIVKPPFVRTDAEAVSLARQSVEFAFDCGASVVSLIPARFGPAELDTLARVGEFSPPALATLVEAFEEALAQHRGRVFVDLWDIEKAGHCDVCLAARAARLREMNLKQAFRPRIHCAVC